MLWNLQWVSNFVFAHSSVFQLFITCVILIHVKLLLSSQYVKQYTWCRAYRNVIRNPLLGSRLQCKRRNSPVSKSFQCRRSKYKNRSVHYHSRRYNSSAWVEQRRLHSEDGVSQTPDTVGPINIYWVELDELAIVLIKFAQMLCWCFKWNIFPMWM